MNSKIAIVLGFLVAASAIVYFTTRSNTTSPTGNAAEAAAAPASAKDATSITLVCGTEAKAWTDAALLDFARTHPEIKVNVVTRGSLDAAQAILEGQLEPTLFNPADSLILELLASDWQTKYGAALLGEDDDAPQPLLLTPLVFVVWEDRAQAMGKGNATLTFRAIHDAVASPRGWLSAGGKGEWGFVKFGHTDPTRSNSGLQTLLLMSVEYFNKRAGLSVADLLDADYQKFVSETERGVTRFEASTGTFMDDMVRFGPSKYDISVVYENLAIAQIENAQGRWGNLRVYYPGTTLWSDHPVALLNAPWVSPAQREAARIVVKHLRSHPVQQRALAFGFRPADPSVPLRTGDAQNPWVRLAPYGLRVDLPEVAQVPDGVVLRNLMMMWSRVVKQR